MTENTNLAVSERASELATMDGFNAIAGSQMLSSYCSWNPETKEEKLALFNATNNPDARLAEMINMEIDMVHVYVEQIEMVNQTTGCPEIVPRIVIIDKDGKSYQCVSKGIFNGLRKLFMPNCMGMPETWTEPVRIRIKQVKKDKNSILVIEAC